MKPRPRILAAIGAAFSSIRRWPRLTVAWVRENRSSIMAALWLAGMAGFVVLTSLRAAYIRGADERERLAVLQAKEQARIDEEVTARLEKRPVDAGADGGPDGGVRRTGDARPGQVGRNEVVELMDIDEIEKARGGSDNEARAAIAGLQEEYPDEDGGVPYGDGGVEMETMVIAGDKPGETVTVRMKKGGLAGWIQRNKKYRKRKLGDKETLEIIAEVTGGVGTKVSVNPNSPLGGLAAIAAIRGSAMAEEAETGKKVKGGNKPGIAAGPEGPNVSGPAKPQALAVAPTPARAVDVVADAGAGTGVGLRGIDLEAIGLAAIIAITSPAEVAEDPGPALDALHAAFAQLPWARHIELTKEKDHLLVRLPNEGLFVSSRSVRLRASGRTWLRDVVTILAAQTGSTIRIACDTAECASATVRTLTEAGLDPGRLSTSAPRSPAAASSATELAIYPVQ